jgi:putative transposase
MYPSDLKKAEWNLVKHFFEFNNGYGNRAKYAEKTKVNAILYVVKSGCQWRMLPKNFPPWKTVYSYYRRLCLSGVWEKVIDYLNQQKRIREGRSKDPSYAIVDSQSVKTQYKGPERGFDGGKKNKGP